MGRGNGKDINRNTVEFKGCKHSGTGCHNSILIETQWNLKDTADGTYTGWYKILIETQWNLKPSIIVSKAILSYHINRNTVEFKVNCHYQTPPKYLSY